MGDSWKESSSICILLPHNVSLLLCVYGNLQKICLQKIFLQELMLILKKSNPFINKTVFQKYANWWGLFPTVPHVCVVLDDGDKNWSVGIWWILQRSVLHICAKIQLNRDPVAQDHLKFGLFSSIILDSSPPGYWHFEYYMSKVASWATNLYYKGT
jgi:hypothetical protein